MRDVHRRQPQTPATDAWPQIAWPQTPSTKTPFHESIGIWCQLFYSACRLLCLLRELTGVSEPSVGKVVFRTPLSEVGQSGVCVSGDRLFLTVHKKLEGPLKGGFYFSSDIVGQCFDKHSGKLLWQVELPGSVCWQSPGILA